MDRGSPVSYLVLESGTPVHARDGQLVGEVERVLSVAEEDVFDGIVVSTQKGSRFVDADSVASIHERSVELKLSAEQAATLPEPELNPAVMRVQPDDEVKEGMGKQVAGLARRAWNRLSGNY